MNNQSTVTRDSLWNRIGGRHWSLRSIIASPDFGVLMILAIAVIYLSWKTDTFTSTQNLRNVMLSFSWIAIAAFGQTLVIITAGIDLSTGSVMALSGLAAAYFISGDKAPWAIEAVDQSGRAIMVVETYPYVFYALLAGCLMGLFLGAINGSLIAWGGLPPFIATLGMMSVARGFCYGWSQGWPFRQLNDDFRQIGQGEVTIPGINLDLGYPTLVMLVLAVIMSIFLLRTVWGYRIYALGGNEQAAALSGINTRHVKLMAYSLAGLLAGLGGTLMTARLGVAAPTAAQGYELDVIAAVFIGGASVKGGKGTILGTLLGAALMQVIRNGLNLTGFEAYWQPAAIGFVIIVAIMLDRTRQNPQVAAYFRQFEGRVAQASVLLMCVLSFALALATGRGADSLIAFFVALPVFAVLYLLYYRSQVFTLKPARFNWVYAGIYVLMVGPAVALIALLAGESTSRALSLGGIGLLAGAVLLGVWLLVRSAMAMWLEPQGVDQGLAHAG